MRHLEARLVDSFVPVEQKVEVERPRAAGRAGPGATEPGLDRKQGVEQRTSRQRRLDRDGRVEEPRLVPNRADRIRLAERRHGHHLDARRRCKAFDGST